MSNATQISHPRTVLLNKELTGSPQHTETGVHVRVRTETKTADHLRVGDLVLVESYGSRRTWHQVAPWSGWRSQHSASLPYHPEGAIRRVVAIADFAASSREVWVDWQPTPSLPGERTVYEMGGTPERLTIYVLEGGEGR